MEYQRKFQKQKTIFTVSVSIALILIVVIIAYFVGSSMVSNVPATTPPPDTTLGPVDGPFSLNDEVLENAIKQQLGITGDLTKEDMERLVELDYDEEAVQDLTGLQFAVNLQTLRLKINATTLSPIAELHISSLTLISDVSVQPLLDEIAKMSYISYLDLTDCGISTLGYISELPILQTLILDKNKVADLSYLNEIRTLTTLSMKNCFIKDISDLRDNISIRDLYIDDNLIEDISPLDSMRSLENCTYSGNPIKEEE